VPLRADLGVDKESVEESEAARQFVMVRGDGGVWEIDEAGVTIALLHIAEHLIVGPVFLDDVNHVLEWRIAACCRSLLPVVGGNDALGETSEFHGRHPRRQYTQAAVQLPERVRFRFAERPVGEGHRAIWIRLRAVALAREDEEFATGFGDGGRVPICRNASEDSSRSQVKDGRGVVVRFRDEQALTVGAQRERVRRAPFGRCAGCGVVKITNQSAGAGVDNGHAITAGKSDVEARAGCRQCRRVAADFDAPEIGEPAVSENAKF
jgi:hypothetical protein